MLNQLKSGKVKCVKECRTPYHTPRKDYHEDSVYDINVYPSGEVYVAGLRIVCGKFDISGFFEQFNPETEAQKAVRETKEAIAKLQTKLETLEGEL